MYILEISAPLTQNMAATSDSMGGCYVHGTVRIATGLYSRNCDYNNSDWVVLYSRNLENNEGSTLKSLAIFREL